LRIKHLRWSATLDPQSERRVSIAVPRYHARGRVFRSLCERRAVKLATEMGFLNDGMLLNSGMLNCMVSEYMVAGTHSRIASDS
jgi:hypothetical protein